MRGRGVLKLKEADVVAQVIGTEKQPGWLIANGWTCVRLNSGLLKTPGGSRMRVGKKGMPDWICVKELRYFFFEAKATGEELGPNQIEWHAMAKRRNIPCIVADGLDVFLGEYGKFAEGCR